MKYGESAFDIIYLLFASLMETIADREHPLSMYVFTADRKWAERVMSTQQYGGGCVNEVCSI